MPDDIRFIFTDLTKPATEESFSHVALYFFLTST